MPVTNPIRADRKSFWTQGLSYQKPQRFLAQAAIETCNQPSASQAPALDYNMEGVQSWSE